MSEQSEIIRLDLKGWFNEKSINFYKLKLSLLHIIYMYCDLKDYFR